MPPPVLMDELVEEVLLRLPPEDPAWLVRASAVCKPWRRILAGQRFRRRYREFHRTPPVLGLFKRYGHFVPATDLFPAQPARPDWTALDCRHGRALFVITNWDKIVGLVVFDPPHGDWSTFSLPTDVPCWSTFSAAVLCAAQGCDHRNCQEGHFLVAFVSSDAVEGVTSGWLYSSEAGAWSELASLDHPNVKYTDGLAAPSVLVGNALYFNLDDIIQCQLGTLCLSKFEKPIAGNGTLMMAEDSGLGFAAKVDVTNLALWSMESGPEGAMGWAKLRVIDLKALIPELFPYTSLPNLLMIGGFAEGTQVMFLFTFSGTYMVDLKSGRARKVSSCNGGVLPYVSFYIPAMEAACKEAAQVGA